jgi:hypothetical protein
MATYKDEAAWTRNAKYRSMGVGSHESPADKAHRITKANEMPGVSTPNFATEADRKQTNEVPNHSRTHEMKKVSGD